MSLYPLSRPCPKCGAKPGELCSNTPAHPCDERWGDLIDGDKLRALDETPGLRSVDALKHFLYQNRAAILAMAEENRRLRDDAARYCWLRDHSCPPHNFYISVPDEFSGVRYGPSEVDAYIDAARQALAAPGDGR